MKELRWDKTLSVDVKEIDEDHRRLVDLFNRLGRAVEEGNPADYIEALLEELVSCTVWHFRHEERLMLEHGYDELEEHRAEHNELIETAKAVQQRFLKEGKDAAVLDFEMLEHWLTEHIYVADMKLGAYLVERG
ncbi:MAG: bacteriohemerythrin [Gammaproteobacteria bacterium]